MTDEVVRLTREQLYELVWSKPLTKLAREYDLSDVGLAKICTRYKIPRPPVGYWTKLAHGYNTKKMPLPESASPKNDLIEITLSSKKSEGSLSEFDVEAFRTLQNEINEMEVPEPTKQLHPLLQGTKEALGKTSPDLYGLLHAWREGCVDISVARSSVGRSMEIVSNLFRIWEAIGLKIEIRGGEYRGTYVRIVDEDVKISLKESTKRTESPDWSPANFGHSRYEYHSTGRLCLRIMNVYSEGIQKVWSDTPSGLLESKLLEITKGVVEAACRLRITHLRQKAEEETRQEQLNLQEEMAAQKRREVARFENLMKDVENWQKSQALRAFVEQVRKTKFSENAETGKQLQEWVEWAMKQADRLDPLCETRIM